MSAAPGAKLKFSLPPPGARWIPFAILPAPISKPLWWPMKPPLFSPASTAASATSKLRSRIILKMNDPLVLDIENLQKCGVVFLSDACESPECAFLDFAGDLSILRHLAGQLRNQEFHNGARIFSAALETAICLLPGAPSIAQT